MLRYAFMERKKFEVKYRQLTVRINKIKEHFDFQPGINGLTPLQNDKIRGMLLLCHAEFESYIESLALLLINDAKEKWDKTHRANYNLASLLVCSSIDKKETIETKVNKMIVDYRKQTIDNNHGIREHNIKDIFEPLGYCLSNFDSAFIATLDSFGRDRGEVAHSTAKTSTMYDKSTEINRIDGIVRDFLDFQEVLLSKSNQF